MGGLVSRFMKNTSRSIRSQQGQERPGSTVNMPKTGSTPRFMKAANTPMKSFIAPKTNFIDVYVTVVPEISVTIVIKDTSPPGPSFLLNHIKNSMRTRIMVLSLTNGESLHS